MVGFVGQDPDASFVADIVEDELAYSMENLGLPAPAMRRRVEDVLDILNLHPLRQRTITSLSGGQRQRVAIGAVLTAAPRLLVLDEPTSSLDPLSAEEVLAALSRLVHDQGVTILVAEHRLERIVHAADVIVYVPATGRDVRSGLPGQVLATSAVAPPIVRLAQTGPLGPAPAVGPRRPPLWRPVSGSACRPMPTLRSSPGQGPGGGVGAATVGPLRHAPGPR